MAIPNRLLVCCVVFLILSAIVAYPSYSDGEEEAKQDAKNTLTHKKEKVIELDEITVTGKVIDETAEKIPAVVETLTPEGIERINTVESSDIFKYMPGSYLRKLYPGASNSPLVIRGNNSMQTARTLVLADGVPISNFLGSGHGYAPRWFMVAPEEIERADLIYGPYSAAFSGNSFSGTALIKTKYPEEMQAQVDAEYFYQNFKEYKTDDDLNSYKAHASFGNKWGDFSVLAWYDRLDVEAQPTSYQAKLSSDGKEGTGVETSGWVTDEDPTGNKRYILGSQGTQDIENNTFKIKSSYDITPDSQVRFWWTFWDSEADRNAPETYLRDSEGNKVYSGDVIIDGKKYNLSPSTFSYSNSQQQNYMYAFNYSLEPEDGFKVWASGSYYDIAKDLTMQSSTAAPESANGGAGKVTDTDSPWYSLNLKGGYDVQFAGLHELAGGFSFNRYSTESDVWNASDWKRDVRTTLSEGSKGKTQLQGLYIEDSYHIFEKLSVYAGGRYEWWKGFDGVKSTENDSGFISTHLQDKDRSNFSPKLSTTYRPLEDWRLRLSVGWADRYPTINELYYCGISSTGIITKSNPDLEPEEVFAKDFTVTKMINPDGEARLTFFEDEIKNAIFQQLNYYTNVQNYQNVQEVRTRGIEFALNKRRFLINGLGMFFNLAWTQSDILRNDNVPDSVGKTFPRVPRWRIKAVADYSPFDRFFMTLAGRYESKSFNTLDNSDTEGGYGGIDDYLVFDTKISYRFMENLVAHVGVDNITDELYHIYHPYPRRTFYMGLKYTY